MPYNQNLDRSLSYLMKVNSSESGALACHYMEKQADGSCKPENIDPIQTNLPRTSGRMMKIRKTTATFSPKA